MEDPYEPRPELEQQSKNTKIKHLTGKVFLLLLAAFLVYYGVRNFHWPINKNSSLPSQNNTDTISSGTGQLSEDRPVKYYYAWHSDDNNRRSYIYRMNPSGKDEMVLEMEGIISENSRYLDDDQYLVVSDNKLLAVNLATKQSQELANITQDGWSLGPVLLSHDRKTVAYGVNYENYDTGGKNDIRGQLWLYDVLSKKTTKLIELDNLGLYEGFRYVDWNKTDDQLIAPILGGDAGAIWGRVYLVDVKTGKHQTVSVDSRFEHDFIVGSPNFAGDQWIYIFCRSPGQAVGDGIGSPTCVEGAELYVYDIEKKSNNSVYHNVSNPDNSMKGLLRIIFSTAWQDNSHAAVSTPGGIFVVDVNTKQSKQVYNTSVTDPTTVYNNAIYIEYANPREIAFSRGDSNPGRFILNLGTGKAVQVGNQLPNGQNFGGFLF